MLLNFICLSIIPVIFIVLGIIFWKHPPKKINYVSGWRTARAMKNQETWDFANRLGGKCFLILGVIELLATLIFLLATLNIDPDTVSLYIVLIVLIQTAFLAIVIIYVERELKTHFK
jgi:uncharacterized membrane protein